MYGGKEITVGDEVFVFYSESGTEEGLVYKGVVLQRLNESGATKPEVDIRIEASASRPLTIRELAPFRDSADGTPQSEISRKLYYQAHNKVARISAGEALFLDNFFDA
ncbi:MAG TPA: hypothetical protein VIM02_05425 [Rhizomicrobium sp.]